MRKAAPATDFASSKAPRVAVPGEKGIDSPSKKKKDPVLPGPGAYNAGASIGANAQKEQDDDVERRKKQNNFNHYKILQYKMNIEKYNYEEKKQRHVEVKKEYEARVGPGAYINPKTHSEFRAEGKPEYLQFFGSTEERFRTFMGGVASSTATIITGA